MAEKVRGMDTVKENYTIFLHKNIRLLRKKMDFSQEELANRIGLNRGNIASYENGTAEPKICNLLKLSNLFGVSLLHLTKYDLSRQENYDSAISQFEKISAAEREVLHSFFAKAKEMESVFKGLYTCYHYKLNSMGEVPRDFQVLTSHFEQLFETSQSLLCNHMALLDLLNCKSK